MVFNSPTPVCPEEIKPHAVDRRIVDGQQATAELRPLPRVHQALEDRQLHSLPVVETCPPHRSESSASLLRARLDVVRHQDQHPACSAPNECRIAIQVTAKVPG